MAALSLNGKEFAKWFAVAFVAAEIAYRSIRWFISREEKSMKQTTTTEHFVKILFFPDSQVSCRTHFTARHGCTVQRCRFSHDPDNAYAQLLTYLKSVRHSIDLCVYMISCKDLADVIVDLNSKGVFIRIITDKNEIDSVGSQISKFMIEGIQVRHNSSSYLMHHKFVVIDKKLLLSGSFNWTRQAVTGNSENLVINDHRQQVREFSEEFEKLWELYDPKKTLK